MFRHVKFWQGVLASILLLQLGAGASLGQDFYFGNFEQDVQFNGQYILDQNATGYAGWRDWSYPATPRPTYSPVTPETTLGVTTGTSSMPWRPAGADYDQGLAANVQDLPAATRDALFAGFFNNTHLAMNVTYNNDDWFLAYNGDGWNGNEVTMSVNYGPTGGTQFVPIGLPDGRPDIDTGNPGEHTGRYDIANYPGVHTRTMMWDYSGIKDQIQTQYNAGNLDEIDGVLEFVMATAQGNFDLGPNAPFTAPAFYVDSWRFTSPNPAPGGLTNYQLPDAAIWPGSPVHTTTTTSTNLPVNFNTEATIGVGGGVTQTFTPTTTVKLDGFAIRAAGAPTTGELYLYRNPTGGSEADGYVNNGFNEGVLIEALPYTFFGTENRTFLMFDLSGGAEVTLEAGVEYSIDLRNTGEAAMYWLRSTSPGDFANAYTGGNIYSRNPIVVGNEGERFDVAGGGRRDGTLALYADLPSAGLPGDFNNDGNVDAEDYTVWRDNLGATSDAALNGNGDAVAGVGPGDYNLWKSSFETAGAGSLSTAAVPEPASWLLTLAAISGLGVIRRRN